MKLNVKPTITEQELKSILVGLSGLDDFELIIKNEYNPNDYGYYYYELKRIVIFTLDWDMTYLSRDTIIKAGVHEITHHVLINHSNCFNEDYHGETFKLFFAKYLDVYYNGEVPKEVIRELKEEGLYVGKTKRRIKQLRTRHIH